MNIYDQGVFIVIDEIKSIKDGIKTNHTFVYNTKYESNKKVSTVIDNWKNTPILIV